MYKFLTKNGQALAFGLGVLITVIFIIMVVSNMESFTAMSKEDQLKTGIFDLGLYGAIILAILAAAGMLLFGIYQMATDLKGSMKGLIGVAVLLAIFFVIYSMSSSEPTSYIQGAIDKFETGGAVFEDGTLKSIGGGIGLTVILILLAFVAAAVSEIINLFK
jgi:hypothetical protein